MQLICYFCQSGLLSDEEKMSFINLPFQHILITGLSERGVIHPNFDSANGDPFRRAWFLCLTSTRTYRRFSRFIGTRCVMKWNNLEEPVPVCWTGGQFIVISSIYPTGPLNEMVSTKQKFKIMVQRDCLSIHLRFFRDSIVSKTQHNCIRKLNKSSLHGIQQQVIFLW